MGSLWDWCKYSQNESETYACMSKMRLILKSVSGQILIGTFFSCWIQTIGNHKNVPSWTTYPTELITEKNIRKKGREKNGEKIEALLHFGC